MIFISYAWKQEDKDKLAKKIYEELSFNEEHKDKIFYDKKKNRIGDYYNKNIQDAIKKSSYFIFINSRWYYESISCWKELNLAAKNYNIKNIKKIIEIKIGDIETPHFWGKDLVYIKFNDNFDYLINEIKNVIFENYFINKIAEEEFSKDELEFIKNIINKKNCYEFKLEGDQKKIKNFLLTSRLVIKKMVKEELYNEEPPLGIYIWDSNKHKENEISDLSKWIGKKIGK